jgi:hypothetical protein
MKHKWKKLGLLYSPKIADRHPKLLTHAANPLPVHLEGDVYRIFYSGRDERNRSSVGAVDIDIVQGKVVTEHREPFFEHGPTGSFFSDGVSIGNCYEADGVRYMLFMGWQNPSDGHWRGDIGRLIVTPDLTLKLDTEQPFLSADATDPISLSYPWVEVKPSGGYNMWYGSTRTWDAGNGEMLHVINHAVSDDGHKWQRNGLSVPYQLGLAQAFSRPSIAKINDRWGMWFSYRSGQIGQAYRIGYAESLNCVDWVIDLNNVGISLSSAGWDSEMQEYPFIFNHFGVQYMLYNGNAFGRSGFGLAVLNVFDVD